MSAENKWRNAAPKKDGKPIVSQSILSLVQSQERGEDFALFQKPDSDTAEHPRATLDGTEQSDETLATLLGAIQRTEIAKRLRGEALPDNGHPNAPATAGPAKTEAATPTLEPPADGPPPAASTQPAPSAAALPEQPMLDGAEESKELLAAWMRAVENAKSAASLTGAPTPSKPAKTNTVAPPEQPAPYRSADHKELLAAWMRAVESAKPAASLTGAPTPDEAAKTDAVTPQGQLAPHDAAENKKLLAAWMRAVESAKPAASLTGAASFADGQPDVPTPAEPKETLADEATFEPPAAVPQPTAAPPMQPVPEDAAESSESSAILLYAIHLLSAILGTEIAKRLRDEALLAYSAPDEPPKAAEALPVVAAPEDSASPEPADASPSRQPSVEDGHLRAPIPAALRVETRRLLAKFGLGTESKNQGGKDPPTWHEKWLGPRDPRRGRRLVKPPLAAFYWTVETPQAHGIANISSNGLYLLTEDRWPEGSIVSMTLQRTDRKEETPENWIAVNLMVIRWCQDGIAGEFIPSPPGHPNSGFGRAENCADKKTLERFVKQLSPSAKH